RSSAATISSPCLALAQRLREQQSSTLALAMISAAEQRLGVRFPELYRAFLTLSNGAHAGEGGPDLLQRGEQFRPTGLPVQEIVPLEVGAPVLWNVYGKGRGW